MTDIATMYTYVDIDNDIKSGNVVSTIKLKKLNVTVVLPYTNNVPDI